MIEAARNVPLFDMRASGRPFSLMDYRPGLRGLGYVAESRGTAGRAISVALHLSRKRKMTSCSRSPSNLFRFFRSLAKDQGGSVAVIAAIVFPVVVGAMGLGVESGYWYLKQRKLQHAADVAVYAASVRYRAGDARALMETAALRSARVTGYQPSIGTITTGVQAGSTAGSGTVSVELTETHSRLFSSVFTTDPVVLSARAVAELKGGSRACVLALSPTAPGAVTVTGSTDVQLNGCSVVSNSNASDAFLMRNGSALMSTDCVYTVGGAITTTGLNLTGCSKPVVSSPPVPDPFAGVPEPDKVQIQQLPCRTLSHVSTTDYAFDTLANGQKAIRFCGGLDIKGNITLKSGLYIIDGGKFTITAGAALVGSGVTFLLTGATTVDLMGNAKIDLSAPTSGPYAGVLMFGSRSGPEANHTITGNSDWRLQGTIYMPKGILDFTGNSTVTGACTQIVADRINFTGNSAMETCADKTNEILVGRTIAIIE